MLSPPGTLSRVKDPTGIDLNLEATEEGLGARGGVRAARSVEAVGGKTRPEDPLLPAVNQEEANLSG